MKLKRNSKKKSSKSLRRMWKNRINQKRNNRSLKKKNSLQAIVYFSEF